MRSNWYNEELQKAILDYRKKNGPFKSLEDLQKVNGIGPATVKALKDQVGFSGVSTPAATEKKEKAAGAKPDDAPKPQAAKAQVGKPAVATPPTAGKTSGNAASTNVAKDKPVDGTVRDKGKTSTNPVIDKLKDAQGNKSKSVGTDKAKPQ